MTVSDVGVAVLGIILLVLLLRPQGRALMPAYTTPQAALQMAERFYQGERLPDCRDVEKPTEGQVRAKEIAVVPCYR